ncbi:bifunctional 4-hydroxy-2-oxoglutarate aldolase/2-dehydro-3-deoxy-phosphogluconate aldolase [Streptomyces sp. NPDC001698]|uniref:bifunctional 4-hydroxy-2-oxoglutarate aldolase/2-dehydro-3-deoxy-phosphogluconate aldolase n=1 Tax=unclassified Streptomyces TaxID=2593676 RepID=UPI0036B1DD57
MAQSAAPLPLPVALTETRVVAVLRPATTEHLATTVAALIRAGVRTIELTATTPDFPAVLERTVRRFSADAVIGAGTLTDEALTRAAIDAGAGFAVSPGLVDELPRIASAHGVPSIVGAWTPSEVMRAHALGADAVKIFPAATGGPAHLRSLREPFPGIPFVPSGGITVETAGSYVAAGAVAVSLGGALTGSALRDGDVSVIGRRAATLFKSIEEAV